MPTYGYRCTACENQFEVFQSIKDDVLTTCESCGGSLKKLIYPVGIAFKGSGFYVNDYAAKPASSGGSKPGADTKPAGGDSKDAPAPAPAASADAKAAAFVASEAKPAASAETKPAAASSA